MDEKNVENLTATHNKLDGKISCETTEVVSIGKWLLTFLILAVPVVNIIMLLFWIFSKNTNKNIKNSLIASLIASLIFVIIGFFLSLAFVPYIH